MSHARFAVPLALAAAVGAAAADPPDPRPSSAPTGDGLSAVFVAARDGDGRSAADNARRLLGPVVGRIVPAVDFAWEDGAPVDGVGPDAFAARFAGRVLAPAAGEYVFRTFSDDGVRVWVDDALLIDQWNDHPGRYDTSPPVRMEAGKRYHLVVEYYENRRDAAVRLEWRTPGDADFRVVPKDVLFSDERLLPQAGLYPPAEAAAKFRGGELLPKDGPAGLRVVSVKDYGAVGDGLTDDTDAIQRAIAAQVGQHRANDDVTNFLYFPNGTYLVSRTLQFRRFDPADPATYGATWQARLSLQGQQRDNAVIRLRDAAPGFADDRGFRRPEIAAKLKAAKAAGAKDDREAHAAVNADKEFIKELAFDPDLNAVLVTGNEHYPLVFNGSTQAGGHVSFANGVADLTVHTGSGNRGAVGVDYNVSNHGAMRNVRVVSGDGAGAFGVWSNCGNNGPGLISDLAVHGFDTGVSTGGYHLTLEHIRLRDQNAAGLANMAGAVAVRDLDSRQRVQPGPDGKPGVAAGVRSDLFWGTVVVTDAAPSAAGDGSAAHATPLAGAAAVVNYGGRYRAHWGHHGGSDLFLRRVAIAGYGRALTDYRPGYEGRGDDNPVVYPTLPAEFVRGEFRTGFAGVPKESLDLPARDMPHVPGHLLAEVGGVRFVAPSGDPATDTRNLRAAAADPGCRVLLLRPGAVYATHGPVDVPYHVKWVCGFRTTIDMTRAGGPGFGDPADQAPGLRVTDAPGGTPGDGDAVDPLFVTGVSLHWPRYSEDPAAAYGIQHVGRRPLVLRGTNCDYRGRAGAGDLYADDIGGDVHIYPGQRAWVRQLNTEGETNTNHGGDLWLLGMKTERNVPPLRTTAGGRTEVLGIASVTNGDEPRPRAVTDHASTFLTFREVPHRQQTSPHFAYEVHGDAVTGLLDGGFAYRADPAAAGAPVGRHTTAGLWLFEDAFQDPRPATAYGTYRTYGLPDFLWEGDRAGWTVFHDRKGRQLTRELHRVDLAPAALHVAASGHWSDYSVAARLRPGNGASASVVARVQPTGADYYELRLSRPAAGADAKPGPVTWQLLRVNGRTETPLAPAAELPAGLVGDDGGVTVRLTVRGPELTAEATPKPASRGGFPGDGAWERLGGRTDEAPLAGGRAGVRAAAGPARFDDVLVRTPDDRR